MGLLDSLAGNTASEKITDDWRKNAHARLGLMPWPEGMTGGIGKVLGPLLMLGGAAAIGGLARPYVFPPEPKQEVITHQIPSTEGDSSLYQSLEDIGANWPER